MDDSTPGTTDRNRARDALVAGLTTTAYYAVPDVVSSRAARFWLKTALLGLGMTTMEAMPTTRAGWEEKRTSWREALAGVSSRDGAGDVLDAQPRSDADPDAAVSDPSDAGTAGIDVLPGHEDGLTGRPSASQRAAAVGVAAVLVVVATAGTVAFERWVYRRGQARAAAGVRFAHTRTGVVMGVLAAAGALVPEPSERR
ncbi:hypothetical protein J1G42_01080 [Cellulomonas sp. zg-ZUI222]|uniref:hypothetical protein n=1 Tax=Cellulomonas wangleii TaxID=2816956 RepID=UPI001A93EA60|nr:hypothetical protein [Cellulomonas wangleii]MBO0919420.1 hypothetical protein [Cellulomonas wangleii]